MDRVAVLIVAAGKGERSGASIPKQYVPILGKAMLGWTAACFEGFSLLCVIGADQMSAFGSAVSGLQMPSPVLGGPTRQESVRRGLEALLTQAPDFVLIHDAARPLVSKSLTAAVLEALRNGAEAAVPLIAVADTLRRQELDGNWLTVPRDGLLRAQTPQGFRFDKILQAHRDFAAREVTDDMALADEAGLRIVVVPGEEANLKVTTAKDFEMAELLLSAKLGEARTGIGFDAHRFEAGDHVWLCGIKIDHDQGLLGHSDADAGLHALTDAILGAIGAGDIGQHFPPSDERWRGAPSWKFLAHAASLMRDVGGTISHCDVTLICERPKVGPHRDAMRARIAEILKVEIGRVSVKATTTEGMGFTGRREGIAAQAVATIRMR